jgi:Rha family phage regulatory protein
MENLIIQSQNGKVVTTSLMVAKIFNKEHNKVVRDIETLNCSTEFSVANFGDTPYINPQNGQTYKSYEITKDGFTFLVMGYTGAKASKFKEDYIKAFNEYKTASETKLSYLDLMDLTVQELRNQDTRVKALEDKVLQLEVRTAKKIRVPRVKPTESIGAEIIDQVREVLGVSRNQFAKKLNYKSSMSIYNITNGSRPLSNSLKRNIKDLLPYINDEFLETGKGEILIKKNQEKTTTITITTN